MTSPALTPTTGFVPFEYEGETYQTYYKIFGDLSSTTSTHTVPLCVLHGGPGLSHDYLLPLADLASLNNTPVIFYDQIGNARSTHLPHKPASFFTHALFTAELQNLLRALSIDTAFDLLGHSWGGILATEYIVRLQPRGLRHLVLANSLAAYSLWKDSVARLLEPFPAEVREGMGAGPARPETYTPALRAFYGVHGCTVKPVPEEYTVSMDMNHGPDADRTVTRSGILNDWTIIDRLDQIKVPTLVLNGRADLAQDFVVAPFVERIAGAKKYTFEHSSHTPFWEERAHFMQVVRKFLEDV